MGHLVENRGMTPGLLFSVERRADFFIAHDCGNFVVHVAQGYIVMFPVVGVDTVSDQGEQQVLLVGVNGGGANASVGVDAREDNGVWLESGEDFVESGSVKCAIPFLHEDDVICGDRQIGNDFTTWSAFDGDANSLGLPLRDRVAPGGL